MCAIVGYIGDVAAGKLSVAHALEREKHRGPDGHGIFSKDNIVLGHARLSIIDIDGGMQPIHHPQYNVTIVVNGEFYGYEELIEAAQSSIDYKRITHSDSEVLIPLYVQYGLKMFEYLRGEFAFILYDGRTHTTIVARDRFGIKPLCWYHDNKKTIFASEAKAVLECGVDGKLDKYSFMHAATMHYQPTDRTLFEDIYQVAPGHALIYQDGNLKDYCYWDLNYPLLEDTIKVNDEEACINEFKELWTEAVRLRLHADAPVCMHLSGGLDSSAIVGAATQITGVPQHCFSIVFNYSGQEFDESHLAIETARANNSVLHLINVTPDDIIDNLSDAVYYSEGLAINGHISCKYLLNKQIRENGFKVALTGEGADECLAGYSHLREDALSTLDDSSRKQLVNRLHQDNQVMVGIESPHGEMLSLDSLSRKIGYTPSFLKAKASMGYKVYNLLSDNLRNSCLEHDFFNEMLDQYPWKSQLIGRDRVNQSLYLWMKLTLSNYILCTLGDGCEMSSSVEGRLPFLDHHLFEYVARLPLSMKIRCGREKYILKEAARQLITPNIYNRQKHPFQSPPITRYWGNHTYQYMQDILNSQEFIEMGLFDYRGVSKQLEYLKHADIATQNAYEPVVMFALTTYHLKNRFGL